MLQNKTIDIMQTLSREFYLRDAVTVARELLGKRLVRFVTDLENSKKSSRTISPFTSGIIVETEAYAGWNDKACHSYKHESPRSNHRTNIMFDKGGMAYVYLIYGMYNCFNVVANIAGNPEAVLIRALEPQDGIEIMKQRQQYRYNKSEKNEISEISEKSDKSKIKRLCNGPGKLCIAMGITLNDYGKDLCGNEIFITEGIEIPPNNIIATPRINVDYAEEAADFPYRFVIRDNQFISTRKFI
ncbi:MAG: DNA-3-methyladenine glycosylase [Planctomycetaceae bacterium]|jgi:DNA-3-methyladenine glycosylase|nr:DNA-3-methyladenine glycosylase [Planctomycetaceae bacterium]